MTENPEEGKRKAPRLVLVGAGYAHLQLIREMPEKHPFDTITLVDVQSFMNYCGMVPGYIAGLYDNYKETIIDLKSFCSIQKKKVRFIHDGVVDVDLKKKYVQLMDNNDRIEFDMISFDIGSASKNLDGVPGASDFAIPTRPIHDLVKRLVSAEFHFDSDKRPTTVRLVVVGGGASGIELAMSVASRWQTVLGKKRLSVTLVTSERTVLPETPAARVALKEILLSKGITMCFHSKVERVDSKFVYLDTGMHLLYDYCLWATGPECHDLAMTLKMRGLGVTTDGWIDVHPTLQSTTHSFVFAAGDCCSSSANALPKAGIYAIQEGPVLARNLVKFAEAAPWLETFRPDKDGCLQFLCCGDQTAIGFAASGMPLRGGWVWKIKNAMDQEFISQFASGSPTIAVGTDINGSNSIPSPSEAAKILKGINATNFRQAWLILQHMSKDMDYREEVLSFCSMENKENTASNKNSTGGGSFDFLPEPQAAA